MIIQPIWDHHRFFIFSPRCGPFFLCNVSLIFNLRLDLINYGVRQVFTPLMQQVIAHLRTR